MLRGSVSIYFATRMDREVKIWYTLNPMGGSAQRISLSLHPCKWKGCSGATQHTHGIASGHTSLCRVVAGLLKRCKIFAKRFPVTVN